jgi:hypothetical protein
LSFPAGRRGLLTPPGPLILPWNSCIYAKYDIHVPHESIGVAGAPLLTMSGPTDPLVVQYIKKGRLDRIKQMLEKGEIGVNVRLVRRRFCPAANNSHLTLTVSHKIVGSLLDGCTLSRISLPTLF